MIFICTNHITSYLTHNVLPVLPVLQSFFLIIDIIFIDPIMSYLSHNVCPIFQIYSSSVNSWCITSFPVSNLIFCSVTSYFRLVCFVSKYKLNPVILISQICQHLSYSSQFRSGSGCYFYLSHYKVLSL